MVANITVTDMHLQPMPLRQLGDKCFVACRLIAAQAMIEVRNREHDAQLRTQFSRTRREGHRSAPPDTATATRSPARNSARSPI